ncbi:MAG: family 10 glycosylhydrolase [Prevotella sp.]|nr:family 10 glycosylhydrolase [Prevotella sp.]
MKRLYILLLFMVAVLCSGAQTTAVSLGYGIADNNALPSPKYEVRAAWLATIGGIDWPRTMGASQQKAELTQLLEQLRQAGINTILFQARVRATTLYPSKYEPWEGTLTGTPGQSPGYDPLQWAVSECHRLGMECHAWVVTLPVGGWQKIGCQQLRRNYSKQLRRIGENGFMSPEAGATGDYLAMICREITQGYDIDGIHLDYIRYPDGWPKAKNAQETARRRQYITGIVRKIHQAVKGTKPWVKLSCSPVGKYDDLTRYRSSGWNARTTVAQDAQAWVREGLMDQLYPMIYFQGNNFYPFAIDWQEQSAGRTIGAGLGIYFLDPREGRWTLREVERQMNVLRQAGLGHCYFRARFLTDNTKGIYDFAKRFDAVPALVPPMTWSGMPAPEAPATLTLRDGQLTWSAARDASGAPGLVYNLYASDTYPVDISRADHIVATHLRQTQLAVAPTKYYAVTAMNRYGLESEARQLSLPTKPSASALHPQSLAPRRSSLPIIGESNGSPLRVPRCDPASDAYILVVKNLMGQTVTRRYYTAEMSVRNLPDGVYQLYSLDRRGRQHRLGFFGVKRR